jgi:glycosyl transferase family 25
LKFFYINLKNRTDRREFIENQAKKHQIKISRIDAISLKSKLIKNKTQHNLFDYMKPAATACTLSHIKVWKEILKQELKFAGVLEDDVILSKNFVKQINMLESSIYKLNFDLIKIESSGDKFVALDHSIITSNELEICKFYNSQLGAAGYIISSSFIKQVINKKALYADAIDTLFFTPKSNFLNKYKIYQAIPAPVVQTRLLNDKDYGQVSISSIAKENKTSNLKFSALRISSYFLAPVKFISVLIMKKSIPNDFFLIFSPFYKLYTSCQASARGCSKRKVYFG